MKILKSTRKYSHSYTLHRNILKNDLKSHKNSTQKPVNNSLRVIFLIWPISNSSVMTCVAIASEVTTYGKIEICILLLLQPFTLYAVGNIQQYTLGSGTR